jgi:hypothetical protein
MKRTALLMGVAALVAGPAFAGDPASIDWSQVPTKSLTLFYPGQSTYQWLRSPEHKRADLQTIEGQACVACHKDEEEELGETLVKEGRLEPTPLPGKNAFVKLDLQAAHDDDYLYLRAKWKTHMNREGRIHDYMRFDGKSWKFYGSHRQKEKIQSGEEPPLYEDRFAIMIDDGKVPMFENQGCWLTCHNSERHMEERPDADEVKAHPYLGKIKKKKDIRKFIPQSRTDEEASWDTVKSPEEIAELKADGVFLDLMQWRVARSNAVGMADDGYVLEYRNFDKGKKMFTWNVNKKTMTPKFMFDPAKTGYIALREDQLADPTKATVIVKEVNAKAYDPNAGFKEGDLLPGRLVTSKTEGSAGDNDYARGTWKDGTYTLVFRRKLDTGHPEDDKILKVGGVYNVGFAIHDDNTTTRSHFVSFPLTLGIGADANIKAVTLK